MASPRKIEKFFEKIQKVLHPRRMAICHYIKLHRATLREFIAYDLDIPEATVYRQVKQLRKWGIVTVSGYVIRRGKKGIKGGPRPEILSIDTPDPEDIARCQARYYKECNVGVEKAKQIVQLVMNEYVSDNNEVNYSDIFKTTKKVAIGFDPLPIAEEAAYNLHKIGVKVWR